MNARNLFAVVALSFVFSPTSPAQNTGTVHEEIIQLEVTPTDHAAVVYHRRIHTTGSLQSEGGRYESRTFESDLSGALVEIRRNSSARTGNSAVVLAAPVTATFSGPGFYPADLSLATNTGEIVTEAQIHNVYVNCSAVCWGFPGIFEANLFSSKFIHVLDQYMGTEENEQYTLGTSVVVKYPITSQFVTAPVVNDADIAAILHNVATKFGSGYSHIYNILLPNGVDYCLGVATPYSVCYSPDNIATWVFCGNHSYFDFPDIGRVLLTQDPYQDAFAINNGVPFYACDVGQQDPTVNTSPTPNGVLVDSTSNILSHEIFETITDSDGLEWQALGSLAIVPPQNEVGDLCEDPTFIYTPFYLSGRLYEIQPEYSNKYHACVTVP